MEARKGKRERHGKVEKRKKKGKKRGKGKVDCSSIASCSCWWVGGLCGGVVCIMQLWKEELHQSTMEGTNQCLASEGIAQALAISGIEFDSI